MKTFYSLLLTMAMVGGIGCGKPNEYKERFTSWRYYSPTIDCQIYVITDQVTGCQYLQVCVSITPMPHSCVVDRVKIEAIQ
jgi:hypothetical protein